MLNIKDNKKVNEISIGPSDSETAVKYAAASMMVADRKTSQETAMNDLVTLKEGDENEIVHNDAVTTYEKDKKRFVIRHINYKIFKKFFDFLNHFYFCAV